MSYQYVVHVAEEPIVCSPNDAIRCFLATDIDYLVLSHTVVSKCEDGGYV